MPRNQFNKKIYETCKQKKLILLGEIKETLNKLANILYSKLEDSLLLECHFSQNSSMDSVKSCSKS